MEIYGPEMQHNMLLNLVNFLYMIVYIYIYNITLQIQTFFFMVIVIYDPAIFYGHHEYDIASTTLFGGYSKHFYDAYFKIIPKAQGFDNRMLLYHLFHYLNHW